MYHLLAMLVLLFAFSINASAAASEMLFQKPTLSKNQIVFVFSGDLWIVARDGGEAKRLTTGAGTETDPIFSPDGSKVAFTGEYDGNIDVYVVAATGGVPQRLTYHPGPDYAVGWSNDGKQVLFNSQRNSYSGFRRLFTVAPEGGFPSEVPLPLASDGCFSPDGSRLAYVPFDPAFTAWKRYRGGRTTLIMLANLADSSVERLPRDNSNDFNPMWIDKRVYFLSDRNGPVTLYYYDLSTKKVVQAIRNDGLDLKSAASGPGAIVYEQFGSINLYDLGSGRSSRVEIELAADLPSVRPRYEKVASRLRNPALSPTGARAVFEARGEIISVPAEKGNSRNLTNSVDAADRDPAWSPDGKYIAYFSDQSGEYALYLKNQNGIGEARKIELGNPPSFFYSPRWSPDSKKISYTDKRLNLWYVDIEKGTPVKIDTNTYENPWRSFDPNWSSDSRWLVYTKQLKNRLCAVFVYSLDGNKSHQLTDGLSDARYASFDKSGRYIYFTASTDIGPTTGWLDMSSFNRPVTRSVYVIVLRKDLPSPLAPESDEEKVKEDEKIALNNEPLPAPGQPVNKEKKENGSSAVLTIDFDNIDQRILALPIPARNYIGMETGKPGLLYLLESLPPTIATPQSFSQLHKFELDKRKTEKLLEGVNYFEISFNGEKMLYQQTNRWFITSALQPIKPGEGLLKIDELEVRVDPRAEWQQMYREVWRLERDFFYDPGYHGLDLKAAEKRYEPYLKNIAHRSDLNYLFSEMLGELTVGHLYVGGGDMPSVNRVSGGLLGADYKQENGRYRFARIYNGENWNPQLRAPLTQPGVNVVEGEYLLAVNGRELRASDNIYSFFESTAGKSVLIKVGPDPSGANAREVVVVPVESETGLRNLAWIEGNRRKVDQMSNGRLAYVYLPNTGGGGFTNFNRYYFAQVDKQGAVIDERFNGGGTAADYIIDYMRRPLMNYWATREGDDFTTPVGSIFGPKAMIIDERAGSGGDALPWYFRKAGIGPLIGKRTWGGLVGIYDYPPLMDGGFVTAPRVAFWSPEKGWEVENSGVAPDIEVDFDPKAWRQGRDPQLEKAVEVVMEALKKNAPQKHARPPYPNYHNGPKRASN